MAAAKIEVYLEVAPKRTFAGAIEWPGWARSGRDESSALEALLAYAPRYARVVGRHSGLERPGGVSDFEVVERLKGGATTEFGVPGAIPKADERAMDAAELARQSLLLESAWTALDEAADAAHGIELRKGPRGGGRDLPKILDHIVDAESSYLVKLGSKSRERSLQRALVLDALSARVRGVEIPNAAATRNPWPPRYFVRRAAWHVLDHAWEIEHRATPVDPEDAA